VGLLEKKMVLIVLTRDNAIEFKHKTNQSIMKITSSLLLISNSFVKLLKYYFEQIILQRFHMCQLSIIIFFLKIQKQTQKYNLIQSNIIFINITIMS
jgi:hypothetical protein